MPMDRNSAEIILYGSNPLKGVVSAEPAGRFIRLFIRNREGVTFQDHPFDPFIITESPDVLDKCPVDFTVSTLQGPNPLNTLILFDTWQDCCWSKNFLEKIPSVPGSRFLFINDPLQQFFLRTGITFFKEMQPDDVAVMAISVIRKKGVSGETISVASADGYYEELTITNKNETFLFERLESLIAQHDPDIIVSEDIQNTLIDGLSRLSLRSCGRQKFRWGRNGSFLRKSGFHGEYKKDKPLWEVYGRNLIDIKMIKPFSGLKPVPLKSETGQNLNARQILEEFKRSASLFYSKASIYPYRFQEMLLKTPPQKANAVLLREYIRLGISLPYTPTGISRPVKRQLDFTKRGLMGPVAHLDVASLYSSIMLAYRLKPSSDFREILLPFVSALQRIVIEHKVNPDHKTIPIKILINSFPFMLETPNMTFADDNAAAEVFRLGTVIIKDIAGWITDEGGTPLEAGLDDIFLLPPDLKDVRGWIETLINRLSTTLPGNLQINLAGIYRSMILYKPGNFALLEDSGRIYVKGSILNFNGLEPYLKDFLGEALQIILEGRHSELNKLHETYLKRIRDCENNIEWISRSEQLTETLDEYCRQVSEGRRNRSAAYEVALKKSNAVNIGERIQYYVSGSSADITLYEHAKAIEDYSPGRHDVNTSWYSERLKTILSRITEFIPQQPELF